MKRQSKMDTIACISVRDINIIDLIKIEIAPSVFQILNFAGKILE